MLATLPLTVGVLRTPKGLTFVNKLDNSLETLELIGNRDDALEIFDMEIDPRNNSRVISGKDVETISELAKINWPPEYLSAEDVKHALKAFEDFHEWTEGERYNGLGLE